MEEPNESSTEPVGHPDMPNLEFSTESAKARKTTDVEMKDIVG